MLVQDFDAQAVDEGVRLTWRLVSDGEEPRLRLYRREPRGPEVTLNLAEVSRRTMQYLDTEVQPGKVYEYALAVVQSDGSEVRSRSVAARVRDLALSLRQNEPNPFDPSTRIGFDLPAAADVRIRIHDVRGRLVRRLVLRRETPGRHAVLWDGTDDSGQRLASGLYFCRLEAGGDLRLRRMLLLRRE